MKIRRFQFAYDVAGAFVVVAFMATTGAGDWTMDSPPSTPPETFEPSSDISGEGDAPGGEEGTSFVFRIRKNNSVTIQSGSGSAEGTWGRTLEPPSGDWPVTSTTVSLAAELRADGMTQASATVKIEESGP